MQPTVQDGVAPGTPRSARPRNERIHLAFSRSMLWGMALLAMMSLGVSFGLGFAFGARSVDPGGQTTPDGAGPAPAAVIASDRTAARETTAETEEPEVVAAVDVPEATAEGADDPAAIEPSDVPQASKADPSKESPSDPPATVAPTPRIEIQRRGPSGKSGLQLGAFESETEATAFIERHAKALSELEVFIVESRIPNKGVWYRVRVGVFSNRGEADRAKARLPADLAKTAILVSYR